MEDLMTTAPDMRSEFTALQDWIAHRVATASEAGGSTWQMTAPLLEGLVPDDVIDGPAVVTARTLGRVLVRQAAAVEQAWCNGDRGPADLVLARLRTVQHRLAVMDDGHYRFAA